jgi:putative ABC transport system permease protein
MIELVPYVLSVAPTAQISNVHVYTNDRVPVGRTAGLTVRACDPGLLPTLDGSLLHGRFLDAGSYPVTVLGQDAATTLGVTGVGGRVWIGDRWFTVAGILARTPFTPEIDRSALVSFPTAARYLGYHHRPSRVYLRADEDHVRDVFDRLALTAAPTNPSLATVYRPSDALEAQLRVKEAGSGLILGLGAVALLVGAIGIANVMVVSVLERRGEIGLRRALGATRTHIAAQFLTESLVLSVLGGAAGLAIGVAVTAGVAHDRGWGLLIPFEALWGGLAVALTAGVVAGIYPAVRAARVPPTDALRTV